MIGGIECVINYLLTESEVFTGKSQTEAFPYGPRNKGRGLRFYRKDQTFDVNKLFITWL